MSTAAAPCPADGLQTPASLAAGWWQRGLRALSWPRTWLHGVRARSAERAQWRALRHLSERTLRDIGVADQMPPQPETLSALDYERGRWS